ncbi:MAG: hypothetical protein Roseis2KO_26370 [Roseivirga sp.]
MRTAPALSKLTSVLVILLCLSAKWWHINSSNTDLLFLLGPLNFIVSLFTNSIGFFDPEIGFYHKSLSIAIDKSCAGFNFLIIAFGSLFCMLYKSSSSLYKNLSSILSSLVIAYLVTLAANCSRILISVKTLHFSDTLSWVTSDWFHQATGSFVFIAALLGICFFIYGQKNQKRYA